MKKCRIVYDICTPTAEARPTFIEDIDNDIHIEEFDDEKEVLDLLLKMLSYTEDDLDDMEDLSIKEKIAEILPYFNDPGDGSPNILYLSIDGEEFDDAIPYDNITLDLATCSEEELKDFLKQFADDDYDY